ncbi:restriction endonuclease subunit S [Propioniciclava sinopodophylli]|uniref:restriction endonuclease subunit S n=1 Tax=Propioniciclava sinopodophylli TaxID=1837344 RepID=UPI001F4FE2FF|nr:restriction endonuclease subunit S [Propioniciclava sinopodophylli]
MTLGDVAEWGSGGTPARGVPSYFGQGMPWLSITDLNDGVVTSAKESLTAAGLANSSAKVVPPGTIFVAMYGSIGKLGIAATDMATSQAIAFARPNEKLVDRRFLFQYLLAERRNLQSRGRGGTQMNISQADLKAWPMPLPPLPEQRRIAAILDHADALHAKRRQVLAHLDALTQAIFHDMFSNEPSAATVEDVATQIRTGPFGSQLLHGEFVDEGIAVLGLDNVVGNEFRWAERRYITTAKYEQLKRYTVRSGDVLISIMGTTGRCVVVPDGIPTAINTKHICAVSVDGARLDPAFLRAAFLWHTEAREHLRRQTKGSIMAGLNMGIIKAMPVPQPPIDRQREFAERARQVAAARTSAIATLAAEDELFASLQARAFDGRL